MSVEPRALARRGPVARAGWIVGGIVAVGVGAIGIVVPGLPTTVFFIVATWCFSRSSPRLERWVLNLPRIGPMVGDYRAGLGMRRRAKAVAISMIAAFVTLSVVLFIGSWPWRFVVLALGAIVVAYITLRVPTGERVLDRRGARPSGPTA